MSSASLLQEANEAVEEEREEGSASGSLWTPSKRQSGMPVMPPRRGRPGYPVYQVVIGPTAHQIGRRRIPGGQGRRR